MSNLHRLSVVDFGGSTGCWDSIHVIEVQEKGRSGHYKLTSTIMLWLQSIKAASGEMNLGGSLTRQVINILLWLWL